VDLGGAAARVRGSLGAGMEAPSAWLLESAPFLPEGGRALDVACGGGRHSLVLAASGYEVTAVDRDAGTLSRLADGALRCGLSLRTRGLDLEAGTPDLGSAGYDVVVVFRYLHRPLFPALREALRPGGVLVYETFTRGQAARGHPRNPAFLLEEGELPRLVAPLEILRYEEGEREGALVAGVVARRLPG